MKYIAFLRAINVSGRRIKMVDLCSLFKLLNLENVETFIASGNVIFDAQSDETKLLECKIEEHLQQELGYEVATFIRSNIELAQIDAYKPFDDIELAKDGNVLFIAFTSKPIGSEAYDKLLTYRTKIDDFHVNGSEIYWLRRKEYGESKFSNSILERVIGKPATLRNSNTIKRLVAKYPSSVEPH